jgi:hypothetical protein
MIKTPQQSQIDKVYELLATHGPATAYAYMEQAQNFALFPESLVRLITAQVTAQRQRRTSQAKSRR